MAQKTKYLFFFTVKTTNMFSELNLTLNANIQCKLQIYVQTWQTVS